MDRSDNGSKAKQTHKRANSRGPAADNIQASEIKPNSHSSARVRRKNRRATSRETPELKTSAKARTECDRKTTRTEQNPGESYTRKPRRDTEQHAQHITRNRPNTERKKRRSHAIATRKHRASPTTRYNTKAAEMQAQKPLYNKPSRPKLKHHTSAGAPQKRRTPHPPVKTDTKRQPGPRTQQ